MAKKIKNGISLSSTSTKITKVKKLKKFNDQFKKKKKITKNTTIEEEEEKVIASQPVEKDKNNDDKVDHETIIEEEIINEKNEEKQLPSPVLAKNLEITYESSAIYTGGKVLFSQCNKYMLTLANYVLHIFDLEENKLFKRIEHVI